MTARQDMTMQLQMGIWRISIASVELREAQHLCVIDAPYVVVATEVETTLAVATTSVATTMAVATTKSLSPGLASKRKSQQVNKG